MKTCTHCHQAKDTHDFYKSDRTQDGLHSWCKACHREQAQASKSRIGTTTEPSTVTVLEELKRRGIPAAPGRGFGMPYVDLVAWGCVPIEAKTSEPANRKEGLYMWHFNKGQRERWFGGLLIFAGKYDDGHYRFFVVPADDIRLKEYIIRDDRETLYVNLNDGTFRKNANQELYQWFKEYEDAFHLIEEYRLRVSSELLGSK